MHLTADRASRASYKIVVHSLLNGTATGRDSTAASDSSQSAGSHQHRPTSYKVGVREVRVVPLPLLLIADHERPGARDDFPRFA